MAGNLPYIDKPETIESLVEDFVRLTYISGNTLNREMNFVLNGTVGFNLSVSDRYSSDSNYKVALHQITPHINEDVWDFIGEFEVSKEFQVLKYFTVFYDESDLQPETLMLMENLEKYFLSKNILEVKE